MRSARRLSTTTTERLSHLERHTYYHFAGRCAQCNHIMLDLIIFAMAIAVAKYIGQKNPLLVPSVSSATADSISSHNASNKENNDANVVVDPIDKTSRHIFHSCLLISLLLFSLSILEAAPISWLVVFHRASLFVLWYRTLLWGLCLLLLVVHPAFFGVILGASMFARRSSISCNNAPPASPSRSGHGNNNSDGNKRKKRKHPLVICTNILWIGMRFFLVTILWRFFRKIMGRLIPYRITRADHGGTGSSRSRQNQKQPSQYCTPGIALASLLSLAISFLSFASMGSLILHFDTTAYYDVNNVDSRGLTTVDFNTNQSQTQFVFDYISLKFMVSVICALGMMVASMLNGFGCASMPHSNLMGVFLKPTPLSIMAKVEDDFGYTMSQLEEKRLMLDDACNAQSSASGPLASSAFYSYTPSKNKASSETNQIQQL